MWELLPETWRLEEAASDNCCSARGRPRRGPVTDIGQWTECFAALAAILSTRFPEKAPHFWSYLRTITKASRNFEGPAWASYDIAYRRQAANRKTLEWSTIDPALYNEAFTGRAKAIPRCRHCLAETHHSEECAFAPQLDDFQERRRSRGSRQASSPYSRPPGTVDLCGLFNKPEGNQCRYKACVFAHICSKCRRSPHPASECGRTLLRPNQPLARQGRPPANQLR